jgi:hypothetical protein
MYQDPNSIVTVQVSTILAPFPSTFQQSGAIVSYGGTKLAPNTTQILTQYADLNQITLGESGIATATWDLGVVTIDMTDALPDEVVTAGTARLQIFGVTPAGYNGIFDCIIGNANQFSYNLATDPGGPGSGGTVQLNSANDLNAQIATYFRQGTAMTVTVLELGQQASVDDQINALEQWINNNTGAYYGYLLPYEWGSAANIPTALGLFQQFDSPESMVYFWLTIREESVGLIPPTTKCVIQLIEAPSVAQVRAGIMPGDYAEFTMAGMFYQAMQYRATSVTRMAPMCFRYIYGVTPYPTQNNGPLLLTFKEKFVNYIQTGAQGGIAYTNVYQGVTADGFDYFNWWWTIDWVQLSINSDLANAVINAANNPLSPLYYDQPGINFLEGTLAATMFRAAQFGMVNGAVNQTKYDSASLAQQIQLGTFAGQCNVNAVPFNAYTTQNPGDYGRGEYDGLSTLFIPARGFVHILVVVVATNLVSA